MKEVSRRNFLKLAAGAAAGSALALSKLGLAEASLSQITRLSEPLKDNIEPEAALLYNLINHVRNEQNLPMLPRHPLLETVARERTREIARTENFSHTNEKGELMFAKALDKFGPSLDPNYINRSHYEILGKLLTNGPLTGKTIEGLFDAFLKSCPHREIILLPNATMLGVRSAKDSAGTYYFAGIFAGETTDKALYTSCPPIEKR